MKDSVRASRAFIKMFFEPQHATNYKLGSSYHLKHIYEAWARFCYETGITIVDDDGEIKNDCYITNGDFIEAMEAEGYTGRYRRFDNNPSFNAKYTGPMYRENKRLSAKIPGHASEWYRVLSKYYMYCRKSAEVQETKPKTEGERIEENFFKF